MSGEIAPDLMERFEVENLKVLGDASDTDG
jgi:hypothetical protein